MGSGVQRFPRTKMVLPLRLWVGDGGEEAAEPQLAHTIDISPIGGRLGGLRIELEPGQTVTLQRGQKKASFRVIWNSQLAPGENQAGIEAVQYDGSIWGVELPQPSAAGRLGPVAVEDLPDNEPATPGPAAPLAGRIPYFLRDRRVLAALCGVILFLGAWLGASVYRLVSRTPQPAAQTAPSVPAAAIDEVTATLAKPHVADREPEITTWHAKPIPRVEVTEPPTRHMVYPVSPDSKLMGKVNLSVLIATDGHVKTIQVVSGKPALVEAAQQAVRQWRYSPYEVKGEPAEGKANVLIGFRGADAVSVDFPTGDTAR